MDTNYSDSAQNGWPENRNKNGSMELLKWDPLFDALDTDDEQETLPEYGDFWPPSEDEPIPPYG